MKVYIDVDELYPYYFFSQKETNNIVNVPKEQFKKWSKTIQQFKQVQEEMKEALIKSSEEKELITEDMLMFEEIDWCEVGEPHREEKPAQEINKP